MKKIKERYSGDKSKNFWKTINNLKIDGNHQELYSLGVALQNFEGYVLRQLENAIDDEKK